MKRVLVIACLARAAYADPAAQTRADALFEKGQADYLAGQYTAAIDLFKQAYELVRDPVYLFNIGQSYRKVLDCENASDYYRRYLDASPRAENKAKVDQWVRELAPCVDERRKEHEAVQRADELERERRAEAARRQAALAPRPSEVDRGRSLRIAGIAVGGAGAIGLVLGIAEGIHGANLKNEVRARCAASCDWDAPDIQSLDRAGHTANTLAVIGYIGGGIAALAGAGLYVWGRARVETVMIAPVSGGAAAAVSIRY